MSPPKPPICWADADAAKAPDHVCKLHRFWLWSSVQFMILLHCYTDADESPEATTSGADADTAESIASMDEALAALEEASMLVKSAESKVRI